MNLFNKVKAICAMAMILTAAVAVSCTHIAGVVTPAGGGATTATPTKTPTVTVTGTSQIWDDFDEAPWNGYSGTGANGFLTSVYMVGGTYNQTTQNTTTYQAGSGSLDVNVNFTNATGNLVETTFEGTPGGVYGGTGNEQFAGVNPSYVSFWVNPTVAMQTTKVWIDLGGASTGIPNVVTCPAGVWTNVVTSIPNTMLPMTNVKAVIIDMTCPTTGLVDVRYDTIAFYSPGTTMTPSPTITPTLTTTTMATATNTPTNTITATPANTQTVGPTPVTNVMWDDFDEGPWVGYSGTGANGYLTSVYIVSGTYNQTTQNTTTYQAGSGSLDVNVNFTTATGNLVETTFEGTPGGVYGGLGNEQFNGVNPSEMSFWVNPTVAMEISKVWIDLGGANYDIANVTNCSAGVWTNVVTSIPNTVPAMTNVKAVIIDMTCPTTGSVDIRYDSIGFYQ